MTPKRSIARSCTRRVGADLDERLDAGRELVGDAHVGAVAIEVAVVVGLGLAVGERRVLIDGAVDGALGRHLEAVEALAEAGGGRRRSAQIGSRARSAWMFGLPGRSVLMR